MSGFIKFPVALLISAFAFATACSAQAADRLALKGATVYVSPDADPIASGVILIRDGVIAAVGDETAVPLSQDTQILDARGLFITAGFWNSHAHFTERKWAHVDAIPQQELQQQLSEFSSQYGFTAIFDLSSSLETTRALRRRINEGDIKGPTILTTGPGIITEHSAPSDQILAMMGWMKTPLPEVANAAQAKEAVETLISDGVDGVKVFAPPPGGSPLSPEILEAVVAEAHKAGKPVFMHPNSGADVLAGLHAGVDVMAHTTPYGGEWSGAVFNAASEHPAALIPTLSLWAFYARHDRLSAQNAINDQAAGQLKGWSQSGGKTLFGTDLGANKESPLNEYLLMNEAGFDFPQILAALTTSPAEFFERQADAGRIEKGRPADLVILDADPATDISALTRVRYTIRAGEIIYAKQQGAGR